MGTLFRLQLDFGDGGLKTGREQELELIRVLRSARPSIVIAPWPDDRHPDHTRTGRIATEASFYSGLTKIDTGQKAHRPQAVAYFLQNYVQPPSFIVDVSAAHERKMKAVASFKSQFYNPDSTEPSTRIAEKSFLAMIEVGPSLGGRPAPVRRTLRTKLRRAFRIWWRPMAAGKYRKIGITCYTPWRSGCGDTELGIARPPRETRSFHRNALPARSRFCTSGLHLMK